MSNLLHNAVKDRFLQFSGLLGTRKVSKIKWMSVWYATLYWLSGYIARNAVVFSNIHKDVDEIVE